MIIHVANFILLWYSARSISCTGNEIKSLPSPRLLCSLNPKTLHQTLVWCSYKIFIDSSIAVRVLTMYGTRSQRKKFAPAWTGWWKRRRFDEATTQRHLFAVNRCWNSRAERKNLITAYVWCQIPFTDKSCTRSVLASSTVKFIKSIFSDGDDNNV